MYGTERVRSSLAAVSPQALRTLVNNPGKAAYYGRLWTGLNVTGSLPMPRFDDTQSTHYLFGGTPIEDELESYLAELAASEHVLEGHRRLSDLEAVPAPVRPRCIALYALVRHYEPEVLVETGVFHGLSTLYVLAALRENGSGHLYSVDVHPDEVDWWEPDVPDDFDPGWIVPDVLRRNWTLRLGLAQEILEPLLDELGEIDLFYHDSNHDDEHKRFEYGAARDHMDGGVISSHDVGRNNDGTSCHAFIDLCEDLGEPYHAHRPFEPGDKGEGVFAYVAF